MLMRKGEWCVSGAYWQFHCLLDIHSYKGADWGQSTAPCNTIGQSTTIYNTMLHYTTTYNYLQQHATLNDNEKTNYNILGPPLRNNLQNYTNLQYCTFTIHSAANYTPYLCSHTSSYIENRFSVSWKLEVMAY